MIIAIPEQHAGSRRSAGGGLLGAVVLTLFLAALAPVLLWVQLPAGGQSSIASFLGLAICAYCAIRLGMLSADPAPKLLATTFFAFVYVWGGMSPFLQDYAWFFPWQVRHTDADAVSGTAQIIIALLAYDLGGILARRAPLRPGREYSIEISGRTVIWLGIAALPLMLLGVAILGGTDVLFQTRGTFNRTVSGSRMSVLLGVSLLRVPVFVAFMLACVYCKQKWSSLPIAQRRVFMCLLLYTAALNLIGNYPPSLPRQWLGTVVLAPMFLLLPWKRWQISLLGVSLISIILFVFPYADAFRRADTMGSAFTTRVVDNLLHDPDFDVYQQTLNIIVAAKETGHSYGANFLAAALFWVPRDVWPQKPFGTGQTVARQLLYPWHQTNLSAPLWSEAYWAFGSTGVALLLCSFGWLSARLDRSFVDARRRAASGRLVTVAVPILAAYQFILLRGDILNGTAQLAPVALLLLLASKPRRVSMSPAVRS